MDEAQLTDFYTLIGSYDTLIYPVARKVKGLPRGGTRPLDVGQILETVESNNLSIQLGRLCVVGFDGMNEEQFKDTGLKTLTVKSPNGFHCYFIHNSKYPFESICRNNVAVLGHKADYRNCGAGYIMGPGSEVPDGQYEVYSLVEPVEFPDCLVPSRQDKAAGSKTKEFKSLRHLDKYVAAVVENALKSLKSIYCKKDSGNSETLRQLGSLYRFRHGIKDFAAVEGEAVAILEKKLSPKVLHGLVEYASEFTACEMVVNGVPFVGHADNGPGEFAETSKPDAAGKTDPIPLKRRKRYSYGEMTSMGYSRKSIKDQIVAGKMQSKRTNKGYVYWR